MLRFWNSLPPTIPKLDNLRIFVEAQSPDVITLCETWLDDSIKNDEVAIEGYVLVRRDRNRHGGGIGMYIRENLSFSRIQIHPSIEFLLISLKLKFGNLLFYSTVLHLHPIQSQPWNQPLRLYPQPS